MSKFRTLTKNKAELRSNLALMQQFCEEVTRSAAEAIDFLTRYRDWVLQCLQAEQVHTSEAIESAIQEAENCLSGSKVPTSPLAKTLLVADAQLRVFHSALTVPDWQAIAQTWISYSVDLEGLCRQSSQAELPKPLVYVETNRIKVFSLEKMTWSLLPLTSTVETDRGSRYVWTDSALFCSGGNGSVGGGDQWVGMREAYLLTEGKQWTVTRLPDMRVARFGQGLWWLAARRSVLTFGGSS